MQTSVHEITCLGRAHVGDAALTNLTSSTASMVKLMRCTFYSLCYELRASTCFEHYLLISRRRYTNGTWNTVCVLRQVIAPILM
jgi:hypothetical protein